MKTCSTLLFWVLLLPAFVLAQPSLTHDDQPENVRCSQEELMDRSMSQNPTLVQTIRSNNEAIAEWIAQRNSSGFNGMESAMELITVPVVFHLVYQEGDEVPTDDELALYLEGVNIDFRYQNDDAWTAPQPHQDVAADTEFEFCFAQRTPDGAATDGITYTLTDIDNFGLFDARVKDSDLGGKNNWDPTQYLNIWLVDMGIFTGGYATFPGTVPAAEDGVVIHFEYFDLYGDRSYRLLNHEFGHWLGLFHIFSNCEPDGDLVDDTPLQINPTIACPTEYPYIETFPFECDFETEENMFSNYMDYTDEVCITLFTQGQKERMHAAVNLFRSEILTSESCTPLTTIFAVNFNASAQTICAETDVAFSFTGLGATEFNWSFEGGSPANSGAENPIVTYNEPGVYDVSLTASNGMDEQTVTQIDLITVLPQPEAIITQNNSASSLSINDGSVQVEAVNGVGPYTFTIQPGGQVNNTGFFEDLSAADYIVAVENTSTGCVVEIPVTIDILSSSTETELLRSQISISPNPNNGRFQVALGKAVAENMQLQLLDRTGREVKRILVPANQLYAEMLEVQELPSGLYFLKISLNGAIEVKKIMIY